LRTVGYLGQLCKTNGESVRNGFKLVRDEAVGLLTRLRRIYMWRVPELDVCALKES
jgi:hypothetical protein